MKIINLKAENVKKLVAVDITPDQNMVVISGKNGAGKSSLLDSIYYALAGKSVIPQKPIRDGEEKAVITLDLGQVIVERTFNDKGTTVKVSTADGAKYQKPQELLDTLLGSICFDPLQFSRQKPRDQYDEIKAIIGIGDKLEDIEFERSTKFQDRTTVNRSLKEGQAYIENLEKEIPEGTPDDLIDISEELKNLDDLKQNRTDWAETSNEINRLKTACESIDLKIKELQDELEWNKDKLKKQEEKLSTIQNPNDEDISKIKQKIDSAGEINNAVAKKHSLKRYKERVADLESQSKKLTEGIEELDRSKDKLISEADLPIDGLDLKDGQVFYNDIPFDQLCSAEKLRIATALAMSADPKLRIVRIQDGALLDKEGMETLEKMAREKDFQVWIERVDSSDPVSIIIEEGVVKNATKQKSDSEKGGNNVSEQSSLAV